MATRKKPATTTTEDNSIPVYIYTRVSTAMQVDAYSLDAQKNDLEEFARHNNYKIIRHYSDQGYSGKSIEGRPQFKQMLADIADPTQPHPRYILCYKLSRFGRNITDTLNSLNYLKEHGVDLKCSKDQMIDSSNEFGEAIIALLSIFSQMERENILAQTFAGRRQKAVEGKWNGGPAPFGYRLDKDRDSLIIDPEEAEVVKLIFNLFTTTPRGAAGVADYLNRHGYRKKTTSTPTTTRVHLPTFTAHFVKLILDNPIYLGKIVYGRRKGGKRETKEEKERRIAEGKPDRIIYAEGLHEAIIDEESWKIAREKREETGVKEEKVDKDHYYLLSGLLRCPSCGGPLYGTVSHSKKKKITNPDGTITYEPYPPYYSYLCRHKQRKGTPCSFTHQYSATKVDSAVVSIIKKLVTEENFKDELDALLNEKTSIDYIGNEIDTIRAELEKAYREQERILRDITNLDDESKGFDRLYEIQQKRLKDNAERQAELSASLDEAMSRKEEVEEEQLTKEKVYECLLSFNSLYDAMTQLERKIFMRTFIESIEVYPEKQASGQIVKAIHFLFPIYYNHDFTTLISVPAPEKPTKATKSKKGKGENKITPSSLPLQTRDETVVLLGRENSNHQGKYFSNLMTLPEPDTYLRVDLDTEKLESNTGGYASYPEIQEYILKTHNVKVTNLNIAQTKRKYNIIERENYNKPKNPDAKQPKCPDYKEELILEALRHFGMIV